jgi:hypothetical protein
VKRTLIFGVTGQDGSYLADILLEKGCEVHGMVRRSATGNTRNIEHLIKNPEVFNRSFFLCRGDLADPTSLYRIIASVKPHEIYNEADQDHVGWSYPQLLNEAPQVSRIVPHRRIPDVPQLLVGRGAPPAQGNRSESLRQRFHLGRPRSVVRWYPVDEDDWVPVPSLLVEQARASHVNRGQLPPNRLSNYMTLPKRISSTPAPSYRSRQPPPLP